MDHRSPLEQQAEPGTLHLHVRGVSDSEMTIEFVIHWRGVAKIQFHVHLFLCKVFLG